MDQTLRIIVADTDASQARAFAGLAREAGLPCDVDCADSAAQVLELLQQQRHDLVVSELELKDGDVFLILAETPQPATIVLTGSGSEQTAVDVLKAGAADYIIKAPDNAHFSRIPAAAERALEARARQSQFRTLTHAIMSIHDSVFITDMDDQVIFVNRAFCGTYGFEEREVLGRHISLFWQDGAPCGAMDGDRALARDVRNRRGDGSEFPVSLSRSVVRDANGQAFAVVGIARDITGRIEAQERLKASLNEKEVLLREIHHRVKNNLQIISSLLNLQSGYIHDAQTGEALRDSQNRVKSMALIHEKLYQSATLTKVDFAAYVQSLVEHVRSSFRDTAGLAIEIIGGPLPLEVDVAVPCGLIVNELLTNAIKHAFPAGRTGRIEIAMGAESTGPDSQRMLLEVCDTGVGLPQGMEPQRVQTLGLQLVTMLAQQLKGEVHFENQGGACCRVLLPLP